MASLGRDRVVVLLIVGVVIAAGLGGYYYQQIREKEPQIEEEPVDYEPPIIEDLQWKPTKVINEKVYDGVISFTARSEGSILVEASVKFVPKMYPHLSPEAFPNESIRELVLEPLDGKFDNNVEDFLVNITDIKGGREYEIQVTVEDDAGNAAKSNFTGPYIREFENLGNLLYDKGLIIGATYLCIFPDPIPWEVVTEPINIRPLLGEYNVRDPIVIAKQIDIFTGYGGNCYFFPWGWDDEIDHKKLHENIFNFISSPLANQIHVAIQYEISRLNFFGVPQDEYGMFHLDSLTQREQWKRVIEDFKVLNNTFFKKENYLKIGDRPVVYWYHGDTLVGDVGAFLDEIRSIYSAGIFMISDHADLYGTQLDKDWLYSAEQFDGWSVWAIGWPFIPVDEPLNENLPMFLEKAYGFARERALKDEKLFMPDIIPGFVELRDPSWLERFKNLPRDADMFSKELDIAFRLAVPREGKKILKIDTWNDFGEGDAIEPTLEEGFSFLETLKSILTAPGVSNFNWAPVEVKNDKIYSLKARFSADDFALNTEYLGISEAELHFVPMIYDHLSMEAFPEEDERIIPLTPLDGVYDEAMEEFEVEIDNIKGGREYLIKIILEDLEGNVKTEEINLPYIREFENFGKQLYDKGIVIGVSYYEYYPDPCPWEELGETIIHPLLGDYNVRDPVVIAKHIDWATGHGINCFFLPWGWDDDYSHNVYHESLVNLVSSPMIDQLHLAMQYENSRLWYHGVEVDQETGDNILNDPDKWKGVIEDFRVLNSNFFLKDNFLTIGGKPVVYWYGGSAIHGKLEEFLNEVKSTSENGIFIFSDHAKVNVINEDYFTGLADEKFFDGWTSWAATWYVPVEEPLNENFPVVFEEGYKFWMEVAEIYDKVLMPSIIPGFVELRDPSWLEFAVNLPRNTEMFSKELEVALKYATQIEGKKIIKIDTWNDFGEGHAIEPTIEEGYAFLEALKDILTFHDLLRNYGLNYLNLTYHKDLLHILSPLVEDGKLDEIDKIFIEWVSNQGENWAMLKGLLYNVTGNGVLTQEEMNLVDTVSIIPNLVSSFDAFKRVPERVYQGQDLTGWEIVVSDHVEPISIDEVDFINYGNYSEVRSNVRLKCLMPLAACFFGKADERLYDFLHISGYRFRVPFTPRATGDQDVNCEIIGGGFQTWHGPSATGYEMGWGWTLNPWSEFYGYIGCTDIPIADKITPDNKWHSVISIFDKNNDVGYFLFDDRVFEVKEFLTGYNPEWREEKISGALVVEVSNAYPGEGEDCYRNMGVLQVKDWFWIWEPYGEEQ